jgi:hypothetical protein
MAPNPNPINFEILNLTQVGTCVVAILKYPDCTNFEGVKICVFEGTTSGAIRSREEIDPHFSKRLDSPVARFQPTKKGIRLAILVAQNLTSLTD